MGGGVGRSGSWRAGEDEKSLGRRMDIHYNTRGGERLSAPPQKKVNVVLVEWRRGNISSHGEGDAEQLTAFLLEMGWVY